VEHEIRLRVRRSGQVETIRVALPEGETLLQAAQLAGLPIASACNGASLCARCGLEILQGENHLPPESEEEARTKARNRIEPGLRLACQATPTGSVEATARYW